MKMTTMILALGLGILLIGGAIEAAGNLYSPQHPLKLLKVRGGR